MNILNQILQIPVASAQISNTANQVGDATQSQFGETFGFILSQIPLWITAIVIVAITFGLAKLAKMRVESKMSHEGLEEEHKEVQIVAGRVTSIAVIVIGATIALSIVGIDLAPIVAAAAFGVGFASQDLIMNLIAGVMILAAKHYTIGDVISVNGTIGRIVEIQTRATIIKAFDGTKIIIPNSELLKNKVINKHGYAVRKMTFIMGAGYDDDLSKVAQVTLDTLKNIDGIIPKPAPKVIFYEWADFEILFKIHVWIDSKGGKYLKVKNEVMMKLTQAYNDANFEMPYPIQTTELTSMYSPAAKLDININRGKKSISKPGYPSKFHKNPEEKITTAIAAPEINLEAVAEPVLQTPTEVAQPALTEVTAPATAEVAKIAPTTEPAPVPTPATSDNSAPQWLQMALENPVQPIPQPAPENSNNAPVYAVPNQPTQLDPNTPTPPSA
ncbi:MAG: mechanosensitive ion channel domain-containing protein [Candidatus Altimarinota bacterium]